MAILIIYIAISLAMGVNIEKSINSSNYKRPLAVRIGLYITAIMLLILLAKILKINL